MNPELHMHLWPLVASLLVANMIVSGISYAFRRRKGEK